MYSWILHQGVSLICSNKFTKHWACEAPSETLNIQSHVVPKVFLQHLSAFQFLYRRAALLLVHQSPLPAPLAVRSSR